MSIPAEQNVLEGGTTPGGDASKPSPTHYPSVLLSKAPGGGLALPEVPLAGKSLGITPGGSGHGMGSVTVWQAKSRDQEQEGPSKMSPMVANLTGKTPKISNFETGPCQDPAAWSDNYTANISGGFSDSEPTLTRAIKGGYHALQEMKGRLDKLILLENGTWTIKTM